MFPLYRIAFWSVTLRSITFCSPVENRNVAGSIRHVSCFHLERYGKMIKTVYYVIHINFPIKSIDSCWKLRPGQHETSRKIYIKLRSIVKNLSLKKIWTKNDIRKTPTQKIPTHQTPAWKIPTHVFKYSHPRFLFFWLLSPSSLILLKILFCNSMF